MPDPLNMNTEHAADTTAFTHDAIPEDFEHAEGKLKYPHRIGTLEEMKGDREREAADKAHEALKAANRYYQLEAEHDVFLGRRDKLEAIIQDAINAALAAEREISCTLDRMGNELAQKLVHANAALADERQTARNIKSERDELAIFIEQWKDKADDFERQASALSDDNVQLREQLAKAQAAMVECDYCSLKEHGSTTALDAAIAEAYAKGAQHQHKEDQLTLAAAQQPLAAASRKLVDLLSHDYWAQCPIDVAKAADEVMQQLAKVKEGQS